MEAVPPLSIEPFVHGYYVQQVKKEGGNWREGILFRKPPWLGYKQIQGCVSDTGSEANILPLPQCPKHGFRYQALDRPVQLARFMSDMTNSPVESVEFTARIGPSKVLPVRFLVVGGAAETIVGLPTLVQA